METIFRHRTSEATTEVGGTGSPIQWFPDEITQLLQERGKADDEGLIFSLRHIFDKEFNDIYDYLANPHALDRDERESLMKWLDTDQQALDEFGKVRFDHEKDPSQFHAAKKAILTTIWNATNEEARKRNQVELKQADRFSRLTPGAKRADKFLASIENLGKGFRESMLGTKRINKLKRTWSHLPYQILTRIGV